MVYLPPVQPVPPPYSPDDFIITENELAGLIKFVIDTNWYLSQVLSNQLTNSTNTIVGSVWQAHNSLLNNIILVQNNVLNAVRSEAQAIKDRVTGVGSLVLQNVIISEDNVKAAINENTYRLSSELRAWSGDINTRNDKNFNLVFERIATLYQNIKRDIQALQTGVDTKTLDEVKLVRQDLAAMESRLAGGMVAQTGVIAGAIAVQTAAQGAALTAQTALIEGTIAAQTALIEGSFAAQTATILAAIGAGEVFDTAKIPVILGAVLTAIVAVIGSGIPELKEIADKLFTNQYTTYQEFLTDFDGISGTGGITKFLIDIVRLPAVLVGGILATASPYIDNLKRLAMSDAQSNYPTAPDFLRAFHTLQGDYESIKENLKGLGYSDNFIAMLVGSSYSLLPPDVLRFASLRNFISPLDHDTDLKRLGYDDNRIEIIKKLYDILPPLSDIIPMAVREVFTPEIAELFGQFEELPPDFVKYAKEQGLSEFWSKNYWGSHWRIPSAEQGFEMFQRNIINIDQLKLLLKANDVLPFWRDKLIQLNYVPLRLVDIRNFHRQGVLTDQELVVEYMNRGYSPTNAQRAAQYTITVNSKGNEIEEAEIRQLTRTTITSAFNLGLLTREAAIERLKELRYTQTDAELFLDIEVLRRAVKTDESRLDDNYKRIAKLATDGYSERVISRTEASEMLSKAGYTEQEIELELDTTDYEFARRFKAHVVNWFKELYTNWTIDLDTLQVSLSEFGFEESEIERLLVEFDVLRETRTKKPTLAQLSRWYSKEIIDLETLVNEIKGLGYRDNYVSWILADMGEEEIEQ